MKNYDHIVNLVQVCGSIEGRKKFQKIVHLLQVAGYENYFNEKFGYLHFGPFSNTLSDEIQEAVDLGLLEEAPDETRKGYATYKYTVNAEKRFSSDETFSSNAELTSLATRLNEKSARKLEAISTICFLMKKLGYSGDKLEERFVAMKPSLKVMYKSGLKEAQKLVSSS